MKLSFVAALGAVAAAAVADDYRVPFAWFGAVSWTENTHSLLVSVLTSS